MVSILPALAQHPSLTLLDEPTASITPAERAGVLGAVRSLATSGVAVVFVSHFLNEVMQVCDVASVLRDGTLVDELDASSMSVERMVSGIVGNRLPAVENSKPAHEFGSAVLKVRNLKSVRMAEPVTLDVKRGKISGHARLLGSSQNSVLKAIF